MRKDWKWREGNGCKGAYRNNIQSITSSSKSRTCRTRFIHDHHLLSGQLHSQKAISRVAVLFAPHISEDYPWWTKLLLLFSSKSPLNIMSLNFARALREDDQYERRKLVDIDSPLMPPTDHLPSQLTDAEWKLNAKQTTINESVEQTVLSAATA